MEIYVVQPGDTVSGIASQFGVSPESILFNNGLPNEAGLVPGQTLVILFPASTVTVEEGDTLEAIARREGVTVNQLLRNNPVLRGKTILYPGQTLVISYTQPKLGTLAVNGYTYPNISDELIRSVLPYLTYVTIFGYGFTPEGELIPPDDANVLNLAEEYRVAPIMLLSTLTESGNFSNELSSLLFNDPTVQDTLIDNILAEMAAKGYQGLDIDFEYIFPEDKDAYIAFVQQVNERLNAQGYFTVVDLAPKTRDDQPGLLYEAHDYGSLGAVSDYVLLMTYEWGYAFSEPMAVAPINNVAAVVDYALTRIPAEKIFMGIPNYGYDWPLPYVKGETEAPSVGNEEALEIAQRYGAVIQYDETAQSPFFLYTDENGVQHEVWFEDARSIQAKLDLANDRGLNGVSYWNLRRPFPQNWLVLNALYDIERVEF